jgi:glycosyltransferase involved in cell wall biosynthesis
MTSPMAGTSTLDARPRSSLRVAMALYSDLDHDSRVLREAASLAAAGHDVTVYCLSFEGPPEATFRIVPHIPDRSGIVPDGSSPFQRQASSSRIRRIIGRTTWMRDYVLNLRAWGRWAVRTAGDVDVWHAHDLPGLMAVGPLVKAPQQLVYDSHEIFLETGTATRMPSPIRRLLAIYERRLARRAAALVTVNEAYAEVLRRRLDPRAVVIVRNCAPHWSATESSTLRLREAAGVPASSALILYHGALGPNRGIEQLVDALAQPGMATVHLALLGFGDVGRLGVDPAAPRSDGRVHVLDAVPPSELLEWVAGADVDVMPLQRSTLNHWLCTPNKLWESLAAGVPVVVSDFPVMRGIVLDDPAGALGGVCQPDDPASIATAIRAIVERPAAGTAELRERCRRAADERWNWETESARLVELYGSLVPAG